MRFNVKIDRSRNDLLSDFSHKTINDRYLIKGETDAQDAFARASAAFADDQPHAQRLYDYASRLWFGYSSPILASGGTSRGLPISCFLNAVDDSLAGIADVWTENVWLAAKGGGIGTYWGGVRSIGEPVGENGHTSGVVPFIRVMDSQTLAIGQGSLRRGSAAVYLDIHHPEIEEFIILRKASGGDANRKALNLHHGVNITDEFMEAVRGDEDFALRSPKTGEIVKHVRARSLWQKLLNTRKLTGEPYLNFIDTANRALNPALKKRGLKIRQSNLCSEIMLPTDKDYTAVCCLSSVNAEKFDEWKDHPQFIEDLARMLDNVLTNFIETAPPEMANAVRSARAERSVGLGCMGLHSRFQRLGISFESEAASFENARIFSHVEERMDAASSVLAEQRGEPEFLVGTGKRFAHKMAVAPNATSGIICGNVSPSIEARAGNAYLHKTLSGSFIVKNPILEERLEELGQNTKEVWLSIVQNEGSVQHLEFLSDNDRAVFKTAIEIDQMWVIRLAAERQIFIDQAQSVNLFFSRDVSAALLHAVHFKAWELGLKSLYYYRTQTESRVKAVSTKTTRNAFEFASAPVGEECIACEG